MIWANSPWADTYFDLWEIPVSVNFGDGSISETLIHWVNDGLMAIFFFQIGLEIKREVLEGELASRRKAALPFMAALGGMIVPVGLFVALHYGQRGIEGWGIPMATDIAFSLGVLRLLGSRVPLGMKVFLSAFAIVDDIGAVLVIALFYGHGINWVSVGVFAGLLGVLALFNWVFNIKRLYPYVVIGLVAWTFLLESGIHPTIAGVLIAFTIPSTNRLYLGRIARTFRKYRDQFTGEKAPESKGRFLQEKNVGLLYSLRDDVRLVIPPLQRMEYHLHGLVAFFILPTFALANAGVALNGGGEMFGAALTLHIGIALLAGKVVGISFFSWLAVRLNLADLPESTRWVHMVGLALLGGIGFTMAIFISNLALDSRELLSQAKLGILCGSVVAGLAGYFLLHANLDKAPASSTREKEEASEKALG